MNTQQIWQAVLGELELSLSKANFTTWFKGTFILELDETSVILGVPNGFTKSWLEKKYNSEILKALRNITEKEIKNINYKVASIKQSQAKEIKKNEDKNPENFNTSETEKNFIQQASKNAGVPKTTSYGLNPLYTFNAFIVGKNNELARAASLAVASNPGLTYNPLFLYGGAGLGKTHLLQAIGHEIIYKTGDKKILYITCEKFTNDFINSISNGKATNFKDLYRSVDVLLIDDIQFLAGKEGTQEEFFHTFNALHQNNKQIVLSSDRPPKSIPALENRLLTRFEWGMIADISLPDYETRVAILEAKMNEKKQKLEKDIITYLANNISSNVRELEGALNRIIAYNQLNNTKPTLDSVKKILSGLTTNLQKKSVTSKEILHAVSNFYDVALDDLIGKCREKKLVTPRQIAMFLLREEIKSSFPTIGHELGGRDHTTAMHAVNKIKNNYDNDERTRREIEQIKQRLYAM
ncbi:MAG: chromosomal replication initiator protein DnaA [Candidatus Buchananbacteria bacterium]|nr:chromosomal replication initiator protein DnaA [Candidatus Buchananbacteria bacterium]